MNRYIHYFSCMFLFVMIVSGVACSLPRSTFHSDFLITPTQTPVPPSDTPFPYESCNWNWATESLPDLSVQVLAAMEAAGLKNISVNAEAYGENCYNTSGDIVRFAAMETDYRISARVPSLSDRDTLGNMLEEILIVLDGFPTGTTPGPSPGYIGVTFQTKDDEMRLWFLVTDGESARAMGMHGATLLDRLQNK